MYLIKQRFQIKLEHFYDIITATNKTNKLDSDF